MARSSFTFTGFIVRWVIALILVLATFNPTQYSLVGWVSTTPWDESLPLKALLALVLVIGYVIYLRATMRSIGVPGIVLMVVLFVVMGWVVATYVDTSGFTTELIIWAALIALSLILAVGLSWSHVRRRISGQMDVDEADIT